MKFGSYIRTATSQAWHSAFGIVSVVAFFISLVTMAWTLVAHMLVWLTVSLVALLLILLICELVRAQFQMFNEQEAKAALNLDIAAAQAANDELIALHAQGVSLRDRIYVPATPQEANDRRGWFAFLETYSDDVEEWSDRVHARLLPHECTDFDVIEVAPGKPRLDVGLARQERAAATVRAALVKLADLIRARESRIDAQRMAAS
jgi:hypothetical protein